MSRHRTFTFEPVTEQNLEMIEGGSASRTSWGGRTNRGWTKAHGFAGSLAKQSAPTC
jgi:hypothetical protein